MASGEDSNSWFGPTSDVVSKIFPDILIHNEGTIFLFQPLTSAAKQWIDENALPSVQWFADALVVEHRFAADLAAAMREDGLILAEGR